MTSISALALSCTLVLVAGCQSEAEPAPAGASGNATGGSGGAVAAVGGSATTGGALAQAGSSSPSSGTGGQPSAGASASAGAATAGSSSAGQAGSTTGGSPTGGSPTGGSTTGGSTTGGSAGNAGSAGAGGSGGLPPLEECPGKPSVDRLTNWQASGEGLTVPATGSILVQDGAAYVGKVEFVGAEWHVIPVYIANKYGSTADLSKSTGFTLTYSATSDLHVQLRSLSHWSGGDQYATSIPSTGGQKKTQFFSFAEAGWKSLFGQPVLSYADTLKEGMGLVFVGNSANKVEFYGLRIDGFTPPCQ
ncbi:MAG TPA: hypothetical protein VNG33_01640 [Polyangiaceae bacterium]|nr:hypothetical protein [Polyangiaceae bacterium]